MAHSGFIRAIPQYKRCRQTRGDRCGYLRQPGGRRALRMFYPFRIKPVPAILPCAPPVIAREVDVFQRIAGSFSVARVHDWRAPPASGADAGELIFLAIRHRPHRLKYAKPARDAPIPPCFKAS